MREDKLSITLYRDILFDQKGRCFKCGVEEWKLKKRLQGHRKIKGRDGGKYIKDNVVLLCQRCHIRIDKGSDKL